MALAAQDGRVSLVRVRVRISKGARNSYSFDPALGRIVLERFGLASLVCPADYGVVSEALGEDGGPVGALVCLSEGTFPGCVIEAEPVALLRMAEGPAPAETVVCVPRQDPTWSAVKDLDDLSATVRRELARFLAIASRPDGDPVPVQGWGARADALQALAEARRRAGDT